MVEETKVNAIVLSQEDSPCAEEHGHEHGHAQGAPHTSAGVEG